MFPCRASMQKRTCHGVSGRPSLVRSVWELQYLFYTGAYFDQFAPRRSAVSQKCLQQVTLGPDHSVFEQIGRKRAQNSRDISMQLYRELDTNMKSNALRTANRRLVMPTPRQQCQAIVHPSTHVLSASFNGSPLKTYLGIRFSPFASVRAMQMRRFGQIGRDQSDPADRYS